MICQCYTKIDDENISIKILFRIEQELGDVVSFFFFLSVRQKIGRGWEERASADNSMASLVNFLSWWI